MNLLAMKNTFLFFIFLLGMSKAIAQDTLIKRNIELILCKVLEINEKEVRYKKWENLDGPLFVIDKANVARIKYANGTEEVFSETVTEKPTQVIYDNQKVTMISGEPQVMYEMGKSEAPVYYRKYRGAGTGTLLPSLLINGLVGLIPAVACSSTPPKIQNLGIPTADKTNNPDYVRGYREVAYKIKKRKTWMNWAIGSAISTTILILANAN